MPPFAPNAFQMFCMQRRVADTECGGATDENGPGGAHLQPTLLQGVDAAMKPAARTFKERRTACRATAGKRQLRRVEASKSGHLRRGPMLQ